MTESSEVPSAPPLGATQLYPQFACKTVNERINDLDKGERNLKCKLSELKGLYDSSIQSHIDRKIGKIRKDIQRYSRYKRRIGKTQTGIIILAGGTIVGVEATTIVLSIVTTGGLLIPVIIGVGGVVDGFLSLFLVKLFQRMKKKYEAKIRHGESILDKAYCYPSHAKEDDILDNEEITNYIRILNEYDNLPKDKLK